MYGDPLTVTGCEYKTVPIAPLRLALLITGVKLDRVQSTT